MTTTTPSDALLKITIGEWASRAVYTAARLGLADLLAEGPRTTDDLAGATGSHPDALGRLLRFLAELEVLAPDPLGWRLGRVGEPLRADVPGSLHDLVVLYGEEFHDAWSRLPHAVATGETGFSAEYGGSMYEYFAAHPGTAGRRFDGAMAAGNAFFADVPVAHDFSAAGTVVDVAGGDGGLLAEVLRSAPGARGTLLEVGHVADRARERLAATGLGDRTTVVDGSYTEEIPPGDVVMLSRILHGRDDAACARLLALCREALPPGGELIVLERIIPADGGPSLAVWFDMQMLAVAGGWERTDEHYVRLLADAGFTAAAPRPLSSDMSLVAARRD